METVDQYLKILEIKNECMLLKEDELDMAISKLTPEAKAKSLVKKLGSSFNPKKPIDSLSRVNTLLSFLPKVKVVTLDRFMSSKVKEYKSLKQIASVVLKNSLSEVSDNVNDYASSLLACLSLVAKRGEKITPKDNLKRLLKETVTKSRKFIEEHEEQIPAKPGFKKEDIPDMAVGCTIVAISVGVGIALGTGIYSVLTAIAAALPGLLLLVVIFLGIAGIVTLIRRGA